jgi:hypothetical protein
VSERADRRRSRLRYPWLRPLDPLILLAGVLPLLLSLSGGPSGPAGMLEVVGPGGADTLELARDSSVSVPGRLGPVDVEVLHGRARISASPCPGQDCVRSGWVEAAGDVSVCMPSGVLIRVIGPAEDGGPDALTY